jgi:hypothetical protein
MWWIKFGRWNGSHQRWLNYQRWYWKGYHWTPFVWVTRRYIG